MALNRPNPGNNPSPALATLVIAGPTSHGSVGGRDVHLFELPALSTMFISAYLFSLNQSQLALFLRDPAITFDALCSAMNEALPPGIGLLAATHCRNFIFNSIPQFTAFKNLMFTGFLTRDFSIFRQLVDPEESLPHITHALFTLDVPTFLTNVCPPGLDLRCCLAKFPCGVEFALKLPQHVITADNEGSAEEHSDEEKTAGDNNDEEGSLSQSRQTIFSATKYPRCRTYFSNYRIDPTAHTLNTSCTIRGSNAFIDYAAAFTTTFGAYPHLLVFDNNNFVPASSSPQVSQFSKNLYWTWYLHTISIAYTGISEFDPSSTEYQAVILQSISAIFSGIHDLSIGPSNALLTSQIAPPSTIFVKASNFVQALPSDSTLWSNENLPYIMFNNLLCVLQERMKNHPSFRFPSIIPPTAYKLTAALICMQLIATKVYDQLVQAQDEFDVLALARMTPTAIVPVHLAHAGFPPVPVVPALVSQAETTMQCYQALQQATQRQHPPQPAPDLQRYQPLCHHHPQPLSAWSAPNWKIGEDPGPPPPY